jgi:NifU-like protein
MVVDGCATNIITGSQALKMVDAKPVDEALKLTAKEIKAALGKFPEANFHCIALAVDTLRATLRYYLSQTDPLQR